MPSTPVKTPQVGLVYVPSTHTFSITATNCAQVAYNLVYTTAAGTTPVPSPSADGEINPEQALTGSANCSPQKTFSVVHLAGTESNGSKTLHQPTGGTFELTLEGLDGAGIKFTKVFTIDKAGKLAFVAQSQEKDLLGRVAGASTDSAMLNQPQAETVLTDTIPKTTPLPVTASPQITVNPDANGLSGFSLEKLSGTWPLLMIGVGILGLTLTLWFISRRRQPTLTPPSSLPPENPTQDF